MFTGIIETLGRIHEIQKDQNNLHVTVESSITNELKIDQSVSHNGICLTVVAIKDNCYTVTAIEETILKTNIGDWKANDIVNLERGMKLGDRLDGHIVQGHVDQTGTCTNIQEANGSWNYTFEYDKNLSNITIEKGSITVNGVSLTVVNSKTNEFSVSIIPYTYENTNFKNFKIGTKINLEFDVVGKYISRLYSINK
ncbi:MULTISPECIES: riboflavin synthase [Flavobacterium]|uniref:Riboflavin synthase n=1 Tax=Flavobacterium cupriresistens TaxID=2893885 RepID=A0ABU4RLR9_9FLAO|nr:MULTISPECIES: riboflavin synthase [unclassified Flavobacterium]KLT69625.1 riboflavin synthase subunit alpha [Flavobacterium sp. ABG]MDX6191461.1 riboflavin synthase [Flavobacterium sp. Fl-318]UFH43225.1 riboflavin synthase [Flavobacterium sp. F-323]